MTFTFVLLKVWNHFDSGSCPGQAIGVKTRLDNGVAGFIPTKFLSDKVVKRPEERVKVRKQWIFTYPARTGRARSQYQKFRVWLIPLFPKSLFKPYFHLRTLKQQQVQVLVSVLLPQCKSLLTAGENHVNQLTCCTAGGFIIVWLKSGFRRPEGILMRSCPLFLAF